MVIDLGLGDWAAEGPAASSLIPANPAAGTIGAQAPDASGRGDVFHALVAAMAGTTDRDEKPAATSPKGAATNSSTASQAADQKEKDVNDAVAVMLVAPITSPAPTVEAKGPAATGDPAAERHVAADVAALVTAGLAKADSQHSADATAKADTPAPNTARQPGVGHKSQADTSDADVKSASAAHAGKQALTIDLGHHPGGGAHSENGEEPAKPAPTIVRSQSNTTTTQNLKPVEPTVTVRTAVPPLFAGATAPASRTRDAAPMVTGAPPPPPSVPVSATVVPPNVREIAPLAFRVSAPLALTPATPIEDVAPQIVQTIRVAWTRGAGEAQIRLDPRQFGDVSVSLRVEAGQVVARIQADAPAVREWLQSNQRTLQSGLAEYHLRLARLDVTAPADDSRESASSHERRREASEEQPPARRPRRQESTGNFEVVA